LQKKKGFTVNYKIWGEDNIDQNTKDQMDEACSLPEVVGGALMPDAHLGYGLPIGGVLALKNAISPSAVGYDIACRMKLTIFADAPTALSGPRKNSFIEALETQTSFGVGSETEGLDHSVMDKDWGITEITGSLKDVAYKQLGSSGSGNHFVEFGDIYVDKDQAEILGLPYFGAFIALMSHSGSRGPGHKTCTFYNDIAKDLANVTDNTKLTCLDMDTSAGQEYFAAMNLMGDFAQANHDVIHDRISKKIGLTPIRSVDNHHNFAWKEFHNGQEVYVHRKGATPAGKGVLGIIPGSMGDSAYLVIGRGKPSSFCSASHGAGRLMSRTQGKKTFNYDKVIKQLAEEGITVLSAGADEVPGVYKNIEEVMNQQNDLVDRLGAFKPRIVKMAESKRRKR
jgi:tRNA-splicing ligase RtcB (3'-phosphate/5'-hydroxy nucleic acid ligase)